jgi:hypothetical protein
VSIIGEAAKAAVGRVFGVKGEGGNIDYHVVELNNHSPANASVRSLLVPGWGQAFNGQRIKGVVAFLSVGAAAGGSLALFNKANQSYDHYNDLGVKDDPSYNDYKRERTQSLLLGTAAILLWVYSVVDAYHNAYNPVLTRDNSMDVAFDSKGEHLIWRRKF